MKLLVFIALFLSVTNHFIAATEPDECLDDSVKNPTPCEDKRYIFSTIARVNWYRANAFCEENQMRLVTIQSLAEDRFIRRKILQLGLGNARWWTGGNDLAEEGTFFWGFRQRKTYTNWHASEPNNERDLEHCTELVERNHMFKWNDAECLHEKFFICEVVEPKQIVAKIPPIYYEAESSSTVLENVPKEKDADKAAPIPKPDPVTLEQSKEAEKPVLNI